MTTKLAPLALALGALSLPACLDRPIEPIEPRRTTTIAETLPQTRVKSIDILLAIDDSGSMADKQAILALAVPNLVDALVNPKCIDADGNTTTVTSSLDDCPAGYAREFEPVLDIHVGVIHTSLGDRGAGNGACEADVDVELLSTAADGTAVPTFEDQGFLAWQPTGAAAPGVYQDVGLLGADLERIVRGVGQSGCGLEAQLESWYRFLIDPDPYERVENNGNGGRNTLVGTDQALLRQRAEFLRPDSLVAIVMLSDENDCSFRADGYGYWTAGRVTRLKPRQECAVDLLDPCCAPCGEAPESCPADPTCAEPAAPDTKLANLTCFEQKRRFGIDLLYPIERYVKGLTETQIADRHGNLVDNPLYVSDNIVRSRDRVFLTGIVGVPWQLIARDPSDLQKGLMSASELHDNHVWDAISGDPAKYVPPSDPHMVESIVPRPGLPGPDAGPWADPMNSHEYDVTRPIGDLQYACIFPLPQPIDCVADPDSCDCDDNTINDPLCQDASGQYHTDQQPNAKAYPSLRQLAVLEGIGDQAIVGSICPAQMSDPSRSDYGYLPTIEALIKRLGARLRGPCFSRSLSADPSTGQVACVIVEGRTVSSADECRCDGAGRREVPPQHQQAIEAALEQPSAQLAGINCFCEIEQMSGAELEVCQTEPVAELNGQPVDGWCYIDAMSFPRVGNAELVSHCEASERRSLRFVGAGEPQDNTLTFISCHDSSD